MNNAVKLRNNPLIKFFLTAADIFERDRLALYSAQASFYIVVSSIPAAMLIVSLAQYILPVSVKAIVEGVVSLLPEALFSPVRSIFDELFSRPPLTLVSISAAAALWSASRGIDAVGRGLRTIYHTRSECGIICAAIGSIFNAVLFIGMFLSTLVLVVFGRALVTIIDRRYPALSYLTDFFYHFRGLFFFIILSLFFTIIYSAYSYVRKPVIFRPRGTYCCTADVKKPRRAHHKRDKTERVYGFKANLPGGILAAVGWVIYSYGYALYIENFTFSASYIYGSLSALVFLLLWLYFCMIIFLAGAEFNRFIVKLKQKYNIHPSSAQKVIKK